MIQIRKEYGVEFTNRSLLFPWLLRHSARVHCRYNVKNKTSTPFRVINSYDYVRPICGFGETVHYRIARGPKKTQPRFELGLWVGRTEGADEHIVLTSGGVVLTRDVRRLAEDRQHQRPIYDMAKGLPWAVRVGVADAIPEELGQPGVATPMPEVAGNRTPIAVRVGIEEGEVIDLEAEAPSASNRSRPAISSASGTPMSAEPSSPRQATPPEQAPRGSPSVKRNLGEALESVSEHDEARFEDRDIHAVTDFAWMMKNNAELKSENRLEEIQNMADMGVFVPVLKKDVVRGAPLFHHTWVDKPEKSRLACCDYNDGKEVEGTFSPTPTAISVRVVEAKALVSGYGILRADICCAFPHAVEKDTVYMRPPREWCDTYVSKDGVSGHEYQWLLVMSLYGRRTAGANWREHFEKVMKQFSHTLQGNPSLRRALATRRRGS